MNEKASNIAPVYLVGAGPGHPGLVTVRAVECLAMADVVIYDYLVNPAIVQHAADTAELVQLGKPGTGRTFSQDEINQRMVEEAQQGRVVVRLKGGDPSVFGRGADEVRALRDAGIEYEIVPGITTGLAIAAFCEIPVTHHEDASAVALVAGRERDDKSETSLDYAALAKFPGTLILYMGVKRSATWSQALIREGKDPTTPVAIVRWGTRAQQEMTRCTLETLAETVTTAGIRPPSVFVVGDVVDRAPDRSWFTSGPLFGTRVLVPSSLHTSNKLQQQLEAVGAEVIARPAIRVTDPVDWSPVDAAIQKLDSYDWLVFSSGNGVDYFMKRLFQAGGDARSLSGVRIAVAGCGTAERLKRYHLKADLVPPEFVAEALAAALLEETNGGRFLLAGTSRGRQVLDDALVAAGAEVDRIVVYSSVDVDEVDREVAEALAAGDIGWIAITSSATARSLHALYGDSLKTARVASMSPVTTSVLAELGVAVAVEASPHSVPGLVQAILNNLLE
ncbi:MAG: uroporphyrinogen-III C-methyltransferase [Gemmatimonadota bacterium]|nr:MAG: uroporphyrinogen-III C-methyltransferase [Gemmatimonadota bacterium]